MTILKHYIRFEKYSNRLELLLNILKLRALGSNPKRANYFNIIYVSRISLFGRKKNVCIYWLSYAESYNKYGT
jgi:hypothetical protein